MGFCESNLRILLTSTILLIQLHVTKAQLLISLYMDIRGKALVRALRMLQCVRILGVQMTVLEMAFATWEHAIVIQVMLEVIVHQEPATLKHLIIATPSMRNVSLKLAYVYLYQEHLILALTITLII